MGIKIFFTTFQKNERVPTVIKSECSKQATINVLECANMVLVIIIHVIINIM